MVGLGNPGPTYAANRHNVGFMAVDVIVDRYHWGPFRNRFQGDIAEGILAGRKIFVLKPTTYMNDSGRSVATAARFFKITPPDVLVFHDELDLASGKLRVKRGGGHAGHNGLRSITSHLGPDFRRVRLGIGHPGDKGRVVGHVLKDFAKADAVWLDPLLDAVAEHFPLLAVSDDGAFMSKVALALNPPPPKPKTRGDQERRDEARGTGAQGNGARGNEDRDCGPDPEAGSGV